MAQVDGGYSSGNWGEPAAWGCSVYYSLISNAGWGNGIWGGANNATGGWGLGDNGLVTASDTVAPNGTFNSLVNENALGIDDSHEALTQLDCQFNDAAQINETAKSNVTFGVSIIETVNTTDEITGLRYFYGTTDDTANVSETVSATPNYPVAVIETTNVNSTILGAIAIQGIIKETANASDTIVGVGYNFRSIEENAAIEDIVSTLAIFTVNIDETSNATDEISTNATFKIAVSETATAQDIVNRRLLWEPIDTGTTEDWVLINTN